MTTPTTTLMQTSALDRRQIESKLKVSTDEKIQNKYINFCENYIMDVYIYKDYFFSEQNIWTGNLRQLD